MPKKLLLTALLLLVSITSALEVEDRAPGFSIEKMDGQVFNYKPGNSNDPILLVFWATWCPVCKEEVPAVNKIYHEFKDQGLKVLAIDVGINDAPQKVAKYIKFYHLKYPVAFDQGSKITRQFGVQGTPTMVIIGRDGIIKYRSSAVPEDLGSKFNEL